MPPAEQVWIYGHDTHLMETRMWVLQGAGFRVSTSASLAETRQAILGGQPMVLILCHTLAEEECEMILALAHATAHIKSIIMLGVRSGCTPGKDDIVFPRYHSPKDLVDAVSRLTATKATPQEA